jgi:hypothetical protein
MQGEPVSRPEVRERVKEVEGDGADGDELEGEGIDGIGDGVIRGGDADVEGRVETERGEDTFEGIAGRGQVERSGVGRGDSPGEERGLDIVRGEVSPEEDRLVEAGAASGVKVLIEEGDVLQDKGVGVDGVGGGGEGTVDGGDGDGGTSGRLNGNEASREGVGVVIGKGNDARRLDSPIKLMDGTFKREDVGGEGELIIAVAEGFELRAVIEELNAGDRLREDVERERGLEAGVVKGRDSDVDVRIGCNGVQEAGSREVRVVVDKSGVAVGDSPGDLLVRGVGRGEVREEVQDGTGIDRGRSMAVLVGEDKLVEGHRECGKDGLGEDIRAVVGVEGDGDGEEVL